MFKSSNPVPIKLVANEILFTMLVFLFQMLDRGALTYNISQGLNPQLFWEGIQKQIIKSIHGKIQTCSQPFSDLLSPKQGRMTAKFFRPVKGVPLRQRF